nr:MAG TPA: hypothetical protein [Caudoviricetes sp.]
MSLSEICSNAQRMKNKFLFQSETDFECRYIEI